jgi:hypothetical protein
MRHDLRLFMADTFVILCWLLEAKETFGVQNAREPMRAALAK